MYCISRSHCFGLPSEVSVWCFSINILWKLLIWECASSFVAVIEENLFRHRRILLITAKWTFSDFILYCHVRIQNHNEFKEFLWNRLRLILLVLDFIVFLTVSLKYVLRWNASTLLLSFGMRCAFPFVKSLVFPLYLPIMH